MIKFKLSGLIEMNEIIFFCFIQMVFQETRGDLPLIRGYTELRRKFGLMPHFSG